MSGLGHGRPQPRRLKLICSLVFYRSDAPIKDRGPRRGQALSQKTGAKRKKKLKKLEDAKTNRKGGVFKENIFRVAGQLGYNVIIESESMTCHRLDTGERRHHLLWSELKKRGSLRCWWTSCFRIVDGATKDSVGHVGTLAGREG